MNIAKTIPARPQTRDFSRLSGRNQEMVNEHKKMPTPVQIAPDKKQSHFFFAAGVIFMMEFIIIKHLYYEVQIYSRRSIKPGKDKACFIL